MRNTAIDNAEKVYGVKSMYLFDGTLQSIKRIRMVVRAAGSTLTTMQIRERLKNGFNTTEKMLRPLAKHTSSAKPERLQFLKVVVKYSREVVVDCVECGQDSPLLYWRIGRRERYRCTRCQTMFEVEQLSAGSSAG